MQTVRAITELKPKAQEACNLFLEKCSANGLKVLITETYRSQERQNELYAQGRTKPGNVVTWTKTSRHTGRMAWDICQNVKGKEYSDTKFFSECGKIAEELGITWGGTWKKPDKPHFEINESWNYKGDDCMTIQEQAKFNSLVEIVETLTKKVDGILESQEKVYHYTAELPNWARPTIQKLLDKGLYAGASESDLNLPETLMRVLVINDRAGFYK